MKKITTEQIKQFCRDRGDLVFIDDEYIHSETKHGWQCCKCSYKWNAAPKAVRYGSGCPKCAGRCYRLSDVIEVANSRKFRLLSTKFVGMTGKYKWECPDGHTWMARASRVKLGTGCPYCHSYITEEACRFIFQELTGQSFRKTRSILGKRLELDGYCDELKIAFEYQGKQHYSFIKHLHRRPEIHEAQKRRDDLKRSLCKERQIDLVEIPYHVDNLEPFIREQLELVGAECSETINWKKFRGRISMLEELKIAADKLDIESLSDVYINARSKMNFRCNKCSREWESTSNDIKNGYGCLKCSGKMKITLDTLQNRGHDVGLKLLSKEYVNAKTKLNWQCSKCDNIFWRPGTDIQQGKGCPNCGRQNGWKKRLELICCES